jgi:chromosomal replication initiation ATPase DnaA
MPLMELASQIQELPRKRKPPPDLYTIFDEVCAARNLKREWVAAPKTYKTITAARHEFYYRAMAETGAPLSDIGVLTGAHHSTVVYGAARYASLHDLPIPRGASCARALERCG